MDTKSIDLLVKEAPEGAGIIAYASTFDRIPDAYGDVVAKGAFAGSIQRIKDSGNNLPLLYGHVMDDPANIIGTVKSMEEDDHGLLIRADFDMENPNAQQVHRAVLAKAITKLSFAFTVLDAADVRLEDGTQVRELRELEIYEVSLVVVPANPRAQVVAAKDASSEALDLVEHTEPETDAEVKAEEPDGAKAEEPEPEVKEEETETVNPIPEKETNMDEKTMEILGTAQVAEKGLKEYIADALATKGSGRFSVMTPEIKGTPGPILEPQWEYTQSHNVGVATGRLGIADLFGYEAITGAAYTFVQIAPKDGLPDTVDEGDEKPQIDYTDTMVTLPLAKIAAYLKESDELIEDTDYVARAIENRGIYDLKRAVDEHVIITLGSTSGIGSEQYPNGGDMDEAVLLTAIGDVMTNSGFAADAILLNPADYAALVAASLSNSRTLFGPDYKTFMGLPICISDICSAGNAVVGAFKQGGTVISKGGIRVEMSNSNEDDFIHNLVCIRIEQRCELAVRVPAAFVLVTEASA